MACATVQHKSAIASGSGGSLAVSPTSAIGSASLVAVATTWDTTGGTTGSSVADDLTVSATKVTSNNGGGLGQMGEIWYYKNYGGGTRTFTLTNSPAQTLRVLVVEEVSGADTNAPLDGTISVANSTGSASPSANYSPAPSLNGEYAIAQIDTVAGATITDGTASGWVNIYNDQANSGTDGESQVQTTAGALAANWTLNASHNYQIVGATFFPAAASAATAQPIMVLPAVNGVRPVIAMMMRALAFQKQYVAPAVFTGILRMRDLDGLSGQGASMKNPLE